MAVAEGHDLVAFQLLVPVEADVVTALLGSCCRAIPVDDGDIKKLVLVKFQYGALKNGVDAAIGFPSSPSTIDARVVDLGTTFAILVDRQLLPLTAQIEQVQNVVEDLEQTQLRCRPTAADGKVWQDKLLEQCETQLRGNRLPTMASSNSSPPENRILSDLGAAAENPASRRLSGKFGALEKRTTSCLFQIPALVLRQDGLLGELKQALLNRLMAAEFDHHMAQGSMQTRGVHYKIAAV